MTAWELAGRGDRSAAAQLVFQQTEQRLRSVQPRSLFPRRLGWPAYAAVPLLLVWFALLWFDFDQPFSQQPSAVAQSLAQQLREFETLLPLYLRRLHFVHFADGDQLSGISRRLAMAPMLAFVEKTRRQLSEVVAQCGGRLEFDDAQWRMVVAKKGE